MRKLTLLLLLLVAFAGAADSNTTPEIFAKQTSGSNLELVNSWQVLTIGAIMLSVIIVAIAYAMGVGFEIPEIKAWADTEMVQIVTNAIIVAGLIGTLAFIDLVVMFIANGSGIPVAACNATLGNSSMSCLQGVTDFYLSDSLDLAKSGARSAISNNMNASRWPGMRFGLYCLTIYCLQFGASDSFTGHYLLDSDMYNILLEYYSNLLGFMEAQYFFVDHIAFKMGPLVLAAGVVARCFFPTRKLGGLMMSVAIGAMFFFPGMYIFDWFTLQMVLKGDAAIESAEQPDCPEECGWQAPIAIIKGRPQPDSLLTEEDVREAFKPASNATAEGIINGTVTEAVADNEGYNRTNGTSIKSCMLPAWSACPMMCRELPYPTVENCINNTIPSVCANLPVECKVKRIVLDKNIDKDSYDACPAECKVVPPLKSNCTGTGQCLSSSYDCRQTKREGMTWRPTKMGDNTKCAKAKDCPANLTANLSCVYVLPTSGTCASLCAGCPPECRIRDVTSGVISLPASCVEKGGSYSANIARKDSNYSIIFEVNGNRYEFSVNGTSKSGQCSRQMVYGTFAVTNKTVKLSLPGGVNESVMMFNATCNMSESGGLETVFGATFNNRTGTANLSLTLGNGTEYSASCTNGSGAPAAECTASSGQAYTPSCTKSGNASSIECLDTNPKLMSACTECSDTCKVSLGELTKLGEEATASEACLHCPLSKRLIHSELPDDYISGVCSMDNCSYEYRISVPRKACERCVFAEDQYVFDPPIYQNCGSMCRPSDKTPEKEAGSYSKVGSDGLVGKGDIKELSKLMIPAYLLPLFNIVATLAFIKGLSTVLGGDIEIPGLAKVF